MSEEEELCNICHKPLKDDIYHIEDIVGHLDCFYKAVNHYLYYKHKKER